MAATPGTTLCSGTSPPQGARRRHGKTRHSPGWATVCLISWSDLLDPTELECPEKTRLLEDYAAAVAIIDHLHSRAVEMSIADVARFQGSIESAKGVADQIWSELANHQAKHHC